MEILIDNKKIDQLSLVDLPMLINGKEGSGASMYTIALAGEWYRLGFEVIFLCGYPMAEEKFSILVDSEHPRAKFYIKEKISDFKKELESNSVNNRVFFVKNVELFGPDLLELLVTKEKLIISGDVDKSPHKDIILGRKYNSNIYFSSLNGISLPKLNKYEGFWISKRFKSITSLGK